MQLYDDLCFLGNNKKKKQLYNNVFNYIFKLLENLQFAKYQFTEIRNIKYNYEDIKELQKIIFYYEEIGVNEKFTFTNDRLFIRKAGMDINKRQWVAINIIEEHLTNMIDEVGKIAYFDKNYSARKQENVNEIKDSK